MAACAEVAKKKQILVRSTGTGSLHQQLLLIVSIITVNAITLSASIPALLQCNREGAACDIITISLPPRLTSLCCSTGDVIRGSVKEELGERESGLQISDGCWETQCVTAGTQTHTAGKWAWVRGSVKQTHTHTRTQTCCAQTTDSLMSYAVIVYYYPFTKQTTHALRMLVATYWMGRQCYPAVYHHSSPLFTCHSVWVNLRS